MAPDARTQVHPRWAMVSTYPPTPCGLATFTQALVAGLSASGTRVDVVRVVDEPPRQSPPGVVHHLVNGAVSGADEAADVLNGYDVVVVQHEFGIYGGTDGEQLLDVLAQLRVPVITVLHTVLADPTSHQRQVLQTVIERSDVLVTMTRTARDRVVGMYGVAAGSVHVIQHGAADALVSGPSSRSPREREHGARRAGVFGAPGRRPVILTWGLLGYGKGIEWGIEALPALRDLVPRPVYVVAGRTHPRVIEREGERYRHGLERLTAKLGLARDVVFDDRYLAPAQLHRMVCAADVVLLPYDSREQVTSGVLIEAVAAGRPVVSSGFPHALELLGGGAGLLVERKNPAQIASALRRVLTEPGLASRLSRQAATLAPDLSWSAVARCYLEVGNSLCRAQAVLADVGAVARAVAVVA